MGAPANLVVRKLLSLFFLQRSSKNIIIILMALSVIGESSVHSIMCVVEAIGVVSSWSSWSSCCVCDIIMHQHPPWYVQASPMCWWNNEIIGWVIPCSVHFALSSICSFSKIKQNANRTLQVRLIGASDCEYLHICELWKGFLII